VDEAKPFDFEAGSGCWEFQRSQTGSPRKLSNVTWSSSWNDLPCGFYGYRPGRSTIAPRVGHLFEVSSEPIQYRLPCALDAQGCRVEGFGPASVFVTKSSWVYRFV
jgi:hypothetical protein